MAKKQRVRSVMDDEEWVEEPARRKRGVEKKINSSLKIKIAKLLKEWDSATTARQWDIDEELGNYEKQLGESEYLRIVEEIEEGV